MERPASRLSCREDATDPSQRTVCTHSRAVTGSHFLTQSQSAVFASESCCPDQSEQFSGASHCLHCEPLQATKDVPGHPLASSRNSGDSHTALSVCNKQNVCRQPPPGTSCQPLLTVYRFRGLFFEAKSIAPDQHRSKLLIGLPIWCIVQLRNSRK